MRSSRLECGRRPCKVEIPTNRTSCLANDFVSAQIDLLVFDAAPIPDLGVQRLHTDRWCGRRPACRSENLGSASLKMRFPRRGLVAMDVEMLRQLGDASVALDGGQSNLRVEGPVSGSSAVVCSWFLLFTASIAAFRQKFHSSSRSDFREKFSSRLIESTFNQTDIYGIVSVSRSRMPI
jgi:hypothetical protein